LLTKAARARNSRLRISPFDRQCWALAQQSKTPDEIALAMNSTPADIITAISRVERWKGSHSRELVEAAMNEQVMVAIQPLGRTLVDGQRARRLAAPAVTDPETGTVVSPAVYEPDHVTRIEAAKATAALVKSVRDDGTGVNVNVGVQTNVGGNGGGRSFEQRVRVKREQLGLNAAPANVIDAEDIVDDGSDMETDDDGEVGEGDNGDTIDNKVGEAIGSPQPHGD